MEKIFPIPPTDMSDNSAFKLILSGITYPDPDYGIYRKCSDVYVAEYVVSGSGTVICNGESFRIKKGDAYILPQGAEHKYYSDKKDPWEKKWINATGKLCEKLTDIYGIGNTVHFPNADIEDLFDELFGYLTQNPRDCEIHNFTAVIFHRIIQRLAACTEKKPIGIAADIKSYIDGNIYAKINANSVAEKFGFSVSQLGRLFKKEYGTTVYSYILEQKITAAEKLLQNSSLSLKETADMLNFTDEHYFSNIFKKKRGIPPGKIRK